MKRSLAANSLGIGQDFFSSQTNSSEGLEKDSNPLDLKTIVTEMLEIRRAMSMGDVRPSEHFEQKVRSMSKEELASALDEMVALQLPSDIRRWLEITLFRSLCLLDPEFTLTRYIDRDTMIAVSSDALKQWAIKDQKSAVTWFDQQIAAGKFESKSLDGKSRARQQLESQLIEHLLSTDPEAAAARLAVFPADQRADVLMTPDKPEAQFAFAKLVRSQLPEADRIPTLARQVRLDASNDGYSQVTDYFERIAASPAERAVFVSEAAETKVRWLSQDRKISREDIDELRGWAATQAPGNVEKATGAALAQSMSGDNNLEFIDAAALASHYHAANGNDDVLTELLSNLVVDDHQEEARILAEKITDPQRRAEILNQIK